MKYHPAQAWRILRQLGWSCQRPPGEPWSATRRRSRSGSGSAGRRLKKSPKRKTDDRFHRRERIERAAPPLPHGGAARTDSGAAIPFQLEDAVGHRGHHLAGTFTSACFPALWAGPISVEFLTHLWRHIPGKLLIVWDGGAAHRSRAVWEFVRQQRGRCGWSSFPPMRRN